MAWKTHVWKVMRRLVAQVSRIIDGHDGKRSGKDVVPCMWGGTVGQGDCPGELPWRTFLEVVLRKTGEGGRQIDRRGSRPAGSLPCWYFFRLGPASGLSPVHICQYDHALSCRCSMDGVNVELIEKGKEKGQGPRQTSLPQDKKQS